MKTYLEYDVSSSELQQQFSEAIAKLQRDGLVTNSPYRLTDEGRRAALAFLAVDELPQRITWRKIQQAYLLPRAMGIEVRTPSDRERVATADGLRAAVLAKTHNLAVGPTPTLQQAMDALAWKQIGVETDKKFSRSAVVTRLLSRQLEGRPVTDERKLRMQLATTAVGARNTNADQLRLALVQQWLRRHEADPQPLAIELPEFAGQVLTVARQCRTGRFGDDKVFISHVWRSFQSEPFGSSLGESEFKELLVKAYQAELLTLSRADLVGALNPNDVRESEIRSEYRTFHFIRVEQREATQ